MGVKREAKQYFDVRCDNQALTEMLPESGTNGDCGCTPVLCPNCWSCCVSDV